MNNNYYIEQGLIRKRLSRAKDNECHICRSTEYLGICPICNQKVCTECIDLAKDLADLELGMKRIRECMCIGCVETNIDECTSSGIKMVTL